MTSRWCCHLLGAAMPLLLTLQLLLLAAGGASARSSACPRLDESLNSTFTMEGQWCESRQLILAPDGAVVAELDYVYISNQKNFVVGGNWYLRLPSSGGGAMGEVVSRTRQSNATNMTQIVEDVLDCENRTVLSVEIDNSGGISFSNGAATTFWVYNSSVPGRPRYVLKLLATRSSLIHSNEIVAYACPGPGGAADKAACGGDADGHDGLTTVATMTTPWLNLVIQHWHFAYSADVTATHKALLSVGLAAQVIGLATSPQSLSWCASSIAAIVLLPLIFAMVTCCCCHRRRCCRCGRAAAGRDPYTKTLSTETESRQYEKMFAVPKRRHVGGDDGDDVWSGDADSGVGSGTSAYVSVALSEQQPLAAGGRGDGRQMRDVAATTYGESKDE